MNKIRTYEDLEGTFQRAQEAVKIRFGFQGTEKGRQRGGLIEAKHALRYVLYIKYGITTVAIGKLTNCDHTTVVHSVQTVDAWCATDKEYHRKIINIITDPKNEKGITYWIEKPVIKVKPSGMDTYEAAEYLGLKYGTFRDMIRNRKIPFTRFGQHRFFSEETLSKYLKQTA